MSLYQIKYSLGFHLPPLYMKYYGQYVCILIKAWTTPDHYFALPSHFRAYCKDRYIYSHVQGGHSPQVGRCTGRAVLCVGEQVHMSQNGAGRTVPVLCIHHECTRPRVGTSVCQNWYIYVHTQYSCSWEAPPPPPRPHALCSHTRLAIVWDNYVNTFQGRYVGCCIIDMLALCGTV